MSKIFAVIENEQELELKSWSSPKQFFSEGYSFLDDCFIVITTTSDAKKHGLYNYEVKDSCDPIVSNPHWHSLRIKENKRYITAHNMLYHALKKHFKGKF